MSKALKFLHYFGIVMFLGSIFTYIAVSTLAEDSSLENLVFARQIIRSGTIFLTVPGMWLIVITGMVMTVKNYGFFKYRWLNIKHILIIIIVFNAHLVIVPATGEALRFAKDSLVQGRIVPEYYLAYMRESIPGALNILLITASMITGIWRFKKKGKI